MPHDVISKWDKMIAPERWPFAIQNAVTICNTTKRRSRNYDKSPWENFTGERSKLDQSDMHPLFCPVFILYRRLQEGTCHPKWTKQAEQKVYAGHLHYYSCSVPMICDSKTELVSPQCHMILDDTFETVQPPNAEIRMDNTMDRLFETNNYKYDDPFGNEHT
jgi:hypothetical protein